ncbi:uncharacterized protein C8orf48 homolog isoform X3 [Alligator sinensis]|uniref:Uncharacterized protein C8orf48 homolog isoform X3 n=1 Tax=Alligator sinensis TaxID=38654 RepID=A0A3Q0H5B5_ALLSI|nr:uncharacterized protein C8orf48 homolog isoform X3 [Alligator sinensis]
MELDSSCSSCISDYSDDTFESFSEEEEACKQYENEPFASYCTTENSECPAVSDVSESTWKSTSQNDEGELLDSATIEKDLMGKWINCLKNKAAGTGESKPVMRTRTEIPEVPAEELDALQNFCTIKISQIHHQLICEQSNSCKHKELQHGFTSEKSVTGALNCIVPDQLVNRIHLKNIRETVKQVTETKVHQTSQCPDCQKKKAELAKVTFLRQRKTLMEGCLLQEKLEEQIYTKDLLTLIGEIHKSLPKLSEDPKNIWQKLKVKEFLKKHEL